MKDVALKLLGTTFPDIGEHSCGLIYTLYGVCHLGHVPHRSHHTQTTIHTQTHAYVCRVIPVNTDDYVCITIFQPKFPAPLATSIIHLPVKELTENLIRQSIKLRTNSCLQAKVDSKDSESLQFCSISVTKVNLQICNF